MAKFVIFLLYFGLLAIQICGQMNSDPAPGRSPGPPGIHTITENHGELNESPTLLLTKDDNDDILDIVNDENDENNNDNNDNLDRTLTDVHNNNNNDNNDKDSKKMTTNSNNLNLNFKTDNIRREFINDFIETDFNKLSFVPSKEQTNRMEISPTLCKSDPLRDFLKPDDIIIFINNTKNEKITSTDNKVDINLEIQHDLFETEAGISCGLMYKVQLTTIDGGKFDEFFVETTTNGQKRGSFVDRKLGNKLPISWFNTPFIDGTNWSNEDNIKSSSSLSLEMADSVIDKEEHNVDNNDEDDENNDDDDDGDVVDINDDRHKKFFKSFDKWNDDANFLDEQKLKENYDENTDCINNKWIGNFYGKTENAIMWMLNEICEENSNIEFRIFVIPRANETNLKTKPRIVYEKIFTFPIIKDCHLTLRESSGSLDYTMLPLNSIDCTIKFPSFNEKMKFAQQLHPPGILIELQRLNVPCDSGAFIQFKSNKLLCGKFEELNLNDRLHHFNVLQNISLKIFKNPMFSLDYKFVDYCYNMSVNNISAEFFIRQTRRLSLECYFLIHLPYGNQIDFKLITNNNSELITKSDNNYLNDNDNDDDDDVKFFTNFDLNINMNVINFNNSINNNYTSSNRHASTTSIDVSTTNRILNNNNNNNNNNRFSNANNNHNNNINKINSNSYSHFSNSDSDSNSNKLCINNGGMLIEIFDSDFLKWTHCLYKNNDIQAFKIKSKSNTLRLYLRQKTIEQQILNNNNNNNDNNRNSKYFLNDNIINKLPSIYFSYNAKRIKEIVSECPFGWIALQQFCIAAINLPKSWYDSELYCKSFGGHLASIRTELQQNTVDQMIINSPGYENHFAYWVGGSDKNFEGDFRWIDGLPFQYTNWFAGWSQHNNYNKQPNDDGLSSQDCIELRKYFRTPPGIQTTNSNPLANRFMWNDRDCNAKNFFICERPITDDIFPKWINDCNKTVSLTKEHSRASLWSPSFPRQYPDNANCYTTITAPSGYRIVIEFEELVIESEPGCTYDYLDITEPYQMLSNQKYENSNYNYDSKSMKVSRHNKGQQYKNLNNVNRNYRKRSSYEIPNKNNIYLNNNNNNNNKSDKNFNNNNKTINFDNAQINNYQNLLSIFSSLYKTRSNFLIQTPEYPKGNPLYYTTKRDNNILPRRLCGDWSSKLKLLRYVTSGSYLGLHFVSDYSHHYGGYKAKAFMENRNQFTTHAASECSDERLKPYNGSCYLFASYPEVDWFTAQQVCRGIGAQLASVTSPNEHRFITTNIRNQIDYSPQIIYWLGAELEQNGQFEWTDDTKMLFEGWLPGQERFERNTNDSVCLGLQWKMSPTPMLPSGLYWEPQKCRKTGGYVCKKKQQLYSKFELNNETITGTEGRLTSPGYPNSYPLNVDYWIHIKAPERWRIIVQFQKIDLESQDECLYDYISVQNYDLVSKLSLEPGTNPIPMAMFAADDNNNFMSFDYESETTKYIGRRRIRRSTSYADGFENNQSSLIAKLKMQMASANDKDAPDTDADNSSSSSNYNLKKSITTNKKNPIESFSTKFNADGHTNGKYLINRKRHRRKQIKRIEKIKKSRLTFSQNIHKIDKVESLPPNHHSIAKRSYSELRDIDNAQSFLPYVRWCGSHDSNMSKFDFVSASNEVVLNFHSDYSISAGGFAAVWKAIDLSGCPIQTLTSREGYISSANYPNFLINSLNCTYVIQAPAGKKVWLEFIDFDLLEESIVEIDIGHGKFQPFRSIEHINEGFFVSYKEQLRVQIRTGQRPRGRGFQAFYRTAGPILTDRIIKLTNNSTGYLYHLNYPHQIAENVDFVQHLVAPLGDIILLELFGVEFSDNGCQNNSILEIYDNYADNNGTKWELCKYQNQTLKNLYGDINEPQPAPVYITSYLNTLYIRQKTTSNPNINLNASIRIQQDMNYKLKLTSGEDSVESCQPNPCQYKGKCVTSHNKNRCQCHGHFTGRFCGLNLCELEPCLFGKCELTLTNFKCHCQPGYMGTTCEQKQRPCADNPCESRGICIEKNGGFFCRCHAWWEGARCERRMMHIPYKPLSERMLQEPFWLGLITVFVVLAFIGLVWCAKRHFPEKIEKLLAEEADRNRPPGSIHGHHHHTSLREQLQFTTSIPQTAGNISQGSQRSIFNRLGIRKPSILSLSSPNPPGGATARTFSLDDLLRPPPRRSPSPRKKRNNSTPVKKNAAEKKQILQQLVSPAVTTTKPKITIDELVQLSENQSKPNSIDSESDQKETTFSENSVSAPSTSTTRPIIDPKMEKKVTFARLLNKVSAEMSSSSDVDGTRNSSALSLPTEIQFRPSSVPPSPCTNDIRSPHSTSSNQGSDSLSSSEIALNDFCIRNGGNVINNNISTSRRNRPKVSSADSILAMFRNFASTTASASGNTTATPSPSSVIFMSPSTTPTVSSPPDDAPGDDESSTSSMHTPVSFSSGAPDSPVFYRQTSIEVPVLDALNAHKSLSPNSNQLHPPTILLEIPSNGINKCLSPIRELPTPMPSPALTPIMPRLRSNSPLKQEDPLSGDYSDDDDKSDNQISANIFMELNNDRNFMDTDIETTPTDTTTTCIADMNRLANQMKTNSPTAIVVNKQQQQLSMLPLLPSPNITIDIDPPTPEERPSRPRDLIIPTLTVEQPSPTRNRYPMIIFPGSPPPQRASIGETSFMFPNKQQQKRLLKQFEKPTSLDLQFAPPTITVTANMSELESDVEPMSPAIKTNGTSLMVPNPVGMCYLSPFTMCTRADRTISESNLSSSGYSSMASPGPSRCGSSNPLCANEMDEPGSGHPGSSFSLHANLLQRRRSSVLASCKENVTNGGDSTTNSGNNDGHEHRQRTRSDSETFSDDVLLESNDEGIGTDHLEEKHDEANLPSKELAIFIEAVDLVERGKSLMSNDEVPIQMAQLQLPSIVIQTDGNELGVSPVSSRSESPLSERASIGRFSPHFYGRKDQLPFTDSDGLYDFPSSDGKGTTTTHQRRSNSKKRERKSSKSSMTQSPTKNHLDIPTKDSNASATTSSHNCSKHCHPHHHLCHNNLTARKSPKRRPINRIPIASSSSSSSESLTSTKELNVRPPIIRTRLNSPNREKSIRKRPHHDSDHDDDDDDDDDEIENALITRISPTILCENIARPQSKIGRLRAIGNQIRFLRRLEKSIKRRERLASPSDSGPDENTDDLDSPKATSPLLQQLSTSRSKTSLCRQKRVEHGTFAIVTIPLENDWNNCDSEQLNGQILSD